MSATFVPRPEAASGPADPALPGSPRAGTGSTLDSDVLLALRNAGKLGLSLVGTWGIALVVRVLLPRRLGPTLFGSFQFADAFTSGLFVLASLGVETYVRKEVATRRDHAGEFYGGLLLLRILIAALLVVGAVLSLSWSGKSPLVLRLVFLMALTQFFVTHNATLAALLHAIGEVDGLSVLSVMSKLVWGGGSLVGLLMGDGVVAVAVAMLASEALKTVGLETLARRHMVLRAHIDLRATLGVLVGSMPFFVTGLSQALAGRMNVSLLSFVANDTELGWYGAASSVGAIALLLSPLLGWVLLPLTARAESRSRGELALLTRRTLGLVLTATMPIMLMLGLGAELIVHVLFGPAFAPAVVSLRMLAPTFVFTYVAIVGAGALVGLGKGWTVTVVSLVSLAASPLLTWLLVPYGLATIGTGGAGAGAALALNLSEAMNAIALTMALGDVAFDRRGLILFGKMCVACLAIVVFDRVVPVAHDVGRVVLDAVAYAVLVVVWKAGDYEALVLLCKRVLSHRSRPHVAAA